MLASRSVVLASLALSCVSASVVGCGSDGGADHGGPTSAVPDGGANGSSGGANGSSGGANGSSGGTASAAAAAVTAGTDISCALAATGALRCWGGTKVTPVDVLPGARFVDVDAGAIGCGVRDDGALYCWGRARGAPYSPAPGAFARVSVGSGHICAIARAGTLSCWGINMRGQLGVGDTTDRNAPTQVGTDTDWKAVRAGYSHTCALKTNGALYCWGDNSMNALGDGNGGLVGGVPVTRTSPVPIAAGTSWLDVDTGNHVTCGLRPDHTLHCWGQNSFSGASALPVAVDAATDWARVRVDTTHACALKTSGTLHCWGTNRWGQLGDGTVLTRNAPQQVGSDSEWADVGVGHGHSCGARKDGSLRCWGRNGAGQLGDGKGAHPTPTKVGAGPDWMDVATSDTSTCGVKKTGELACWGDETFIAGTDIHDEPHTMSAATTWSSVALGPRRACATQVDGSLHCWGWNHNGAVGVSKAMGDLFTPTPVGLTGTTSVALGEDHTCAVAGGSLHCWGKGTSNQNGLARDTDVPTEVGTATWSKVAASARSTCALRADGTLHCFGMGYYTPMHALGEIAWSDVTSWPTGTAEVFFVREGASLSRFSYTEPRTTVAGDWKYAALGVEHWCGIKTDGTLWCSGRNLTGEVGDGTYVERTVPVQIGTANDWTRVATGGRHTCGLRSGGELHCWGANEGGQIGDGTGWSTTPVPVN